MPYKGCINYSIFLAFPKKKKKKKIRFPQPQALFWTYRIVANPNFYIDCNYMYKKMSFE